jgi:S1-C subfamily serine protease
MGMLLLWAALPRLLREESHSAALGLALAILFGAGYWALAMAAAGAGRAGVRVFTGTIPDYSTEIKGLLLNGVIGGGPAEQAGLQKGDVLIEIAGQSITNIYDYTYALETLKIGQPAKVIFLRNGERKETTLVPAARK